MTTVYRDRPERVAQVFWPLSRYVPSGCLTEMQVMALLSEPAAGSEMAVEATQVLSTFSMAFMMSSCWALLPKSMTSVMEFVSVVKGSAVPVNSCSFSVRRIWVSLLQGTPPTSSGRPRCMKPASR